MSSTTPFGGRRPWTLSIHWPERSARAERFFSAASHCVSKRPIWLGEAAQPEVARRSFRPMDRYPPWLSKYAIRLPTNRVLQERIGYLLKRPVGRPSYVLFRHASLAGLE